MRRPSLEALLPSLLERGRALEPWEAVTIVSSVASPAWSLWRLHVEGLLDAESVTLGLAVAWTRSRRPASALPLTAWGELLAATVPAVDGDATVVPPAGVRAVVDGVRLAVDSYGCLVVLDEVGA